MKSVLPNNSLKEEMASIPIAIEEDTTKGYSDARNQSLENNSNITESSLPLDYSTEEKPPLQPPYPNNIYPGAIEDNSGPLQAIEGLERRADGYQRLDFPDAALMLSFYDPVFTAKVNPVTLHKWQTDFHEKAAAAKPTQQEPYKECLLTCNGSGKDAFIIAGWVAWFAACKIKSRCVITSASGVQLTSQTENYLAAFCRKVNDFHDCEIFKIRQRFIKCLLSGSEIRLFATDEAGRAEGYHPLEPGAEMTIIINEAKTVSEEIHGALRRCTGYNYWFEISSAGEPHGSFYKAFTNWTNVRRITAYDCSHISRSEIEEAKRDLGENSALFRSIYLALFTSLGGEIIIPQELVDKLLTLTFEAAFQNWEERIGIDLAAGGDENALCRTRGNKCIQEVAFREEDTEVTADRIDITLTKWQISKSHKHIYADDGGVGRAIIDKLVRRGWSINRVLNQSAATFKKVYGNRGAENWYRVARILEERFFDVSTLTEKTREQLYTRHYKKSSVGGRIFLESKKEAKSEGRPSPDRADAFILSQTGLTIDDFLKGNGKKGEEKADERPREQFKTQQEVLEHYENTVTFGRFNKLETNQGRIRKIYNSLKMAMRN